MSHFQRKSRRQRLLHSLGDALPGTTTIRSALPGKRLNAGLPKAAELAGRLPKDMGAKAGLVAGGLTLVTASSSGISTLRRRQERRASDS